MKLTDNDGLVDDLLRTLERAGGELGAVATYAPGGDWQVTWNAIPAAQRTAAAHTLTITALRAAHELLEASNTAHLFQLDTRTERLDASVRALCYLAALLRQLARDADAEDRP